ncbi:hypothetical protein SAMN05421855_10680 [Ulvibacter litoralis]|uniref:Uncharacterized protein n=1 Tax=Ulvibacter litoralis TaxID=227084 RepID=A0A1G7ILS8_9FLAO|nr:hypothetical protein SAMN05421855_10680 [Ulvibacter litoralis]
MERPLTCLLLLTPQLIKLYKDEIYKEPSQEG